jgi:hypothetical protein
MSMMHDGHCTNGTDDQVDRTAAAAATVNGVWTKLSPSRIPPDSIGGTNALEWEKKKKKKKKKKRSE